MKKRLKLFFIFVLTACFMACWQPQNSRGAGKSFKEEVLKELNYARTKPSEYAKNILEPRIARFSGKNYLQDDGIYLTTNEGVAPVKEAINALEKQTPLEPLSIDWDLCKASQFFAEYQANSGTTGHGGPNGMTTQSRIEKYGKWDGYIGENCAYGPKTAREIVAQLIIDDGVSDRGHRKNIFKGEFLEVGISYIEGRNAAFGSVCVMDFATSFQGF